MDSPAEVGCGLPLCNGSLSSLCSSTARLLEPVEHLAYGSIPLQRVLILQLLHLQQQ